MARNSWLMKSEPEVYSFDDLWKAPRRTTGWEGVRNYQARNFLRDRFAKGDEILFYHSSTAAPAVIGTASVVRAGHPDRTQFDSKSEFFDPKATQKAPRWYSVEIRAEERFLHPVPLVSLRREAGLSRMVLLQKGSRLSIQPVTIAEWEIVVALGRKAIPALGA